MRCKAGIEYSLHNRKFKIIMKQGGFVSVVRVLATCFMPPYVVRVAFEQLLRIKRASTMCERSLALTKIR